MEYMCLFQFSYTSGYIPRSGVARSYGGFIPSFLKKSPYHLPQWLYKFTLPPTVQEYSLFSTCSPAFIVCRVFDDGHSDPCEVISHCSFDLHFSNNEWCWTFFMCLWDICMSFWRNVCLGLFQILWLGCLFFWYWVVWAACIFWKLILCQLFHLLLFSPILRVVFLPCLWLPASFAVQKLLSLIRPHLFSFVLFPLL